MQWLSTLAAVFITINFGNRTSATDAGERKYGEWYLWIYICACRIESGDSIVGSNDDERQLLVAAVEKLDGKTVEAVQIEQWALGLAIEFSEATTIRTFGGAL
jgi:hypothetical protein